MTTDRTTTLGIMAAILMSQDTERKEMERHARELRPEDRRSKFEEYTACLLEAVEEHIAYEAAEGNA